MIIMPANPLIDQKRVGAVLQARGAGILLPKQAGAKRIRAAISRVLTEPAYRDAAAGLGELIRAHDGAERAADTIAEFVSRRTPVA
jgi:UDP:flavonoid glycosyltransferase YjiC (YdhE family)